MTFKPFHSPAKAGELLGMALDPSIHLVFKFFGHRGRVVATWVNPPPGRPRDVIARQKDFVRIP